MGTMAGGPIFVSYARADSAWVSPLVEPLFSEHVFFFDVDEISAGDSITRKIREAIEHAELGLVFRSPVADQRPWLVTERAALQSAGVPVLDVERGTSVEALRAMIDQRLKRMREPRPFVLAARADEASACKLECALGAQCFVDGGASLSALISAIEQEHPLVVLWSTAARADKALNELLDGVLIGQISKGHRQLLVWRLDETPAHPLLAAVAEARTQDELLARFTGRASLRPYRTVARPRLAEEYASLLLAQRRLLLLGPRRGGVRTLVPEVVQKSGFGPCHTLLSPAPAAGCSEGAYYRHLTRNAASSPIEYAEWQLEQAAGRAHLIVLMHDGGDAQHFATLAATLRGLVEQQSQISILTAGEVRAAALRFDTRETSLFTGMPVRRVPALDVHEVREVLKHAGYEALALGVWLATGGHPGLLKELVSEPGGLRQDDATRRLASSPQIAGVLRFRLREDSARGRKQSHASEVLRSLLEGSAVEPLSAIQEDLTRPEVRLYYDGLLCSTRSGKTEFRCEAVRVAAETALRLWEQESAL